MTMNSPSRTYKVVDVFTRHPMLGNPVAVVLDTDGLTTEDMQRIARWTNLSETTFVLNPTQAGADYRLRIFTPRNELPFAGHPTLGSAHAVLETGRIQTQNGRLVQECAVGLVEVSVHGQADERVLTFALPPATLTSLQADDIAELEAVLGHAIERQFTPAIVNVGPRWVVAQLPDANSLLALQPNFTREAALERRLGVTGISVFAPHASGQAAIEVRSFVPNSGIDEDPVCGSGNGSVAVFRRERGLLPAGDHQYIATQGRCLGRDGRVSVEVSAQGQVMVGGACITCVDGTLRC